MNLIFLLNLNNVFKCGSLKLKIIQIYKKKLFNQYLNSANVNTLRNMGRHYTYSHTKNELAAAKQKLRNIERSRPSKISKFFGFGRTQPTSNIN